MPRYMLSVQRTKHSGCLLVTIGVATVVVHSSFVHFCGFFLILFFLFAFFRGVTSYF